jgi:hypothetical protein
MVMRFCARVWRKQGVRLLVLWTASLDILLGACGFCRAQQVTGKHPIVISIDRFQLLTEGKQFFLQPMSAAKAQRLPIPRDWLIPPQEEKDEEEEPVSSFRYDHRVTSFPIGNGEVGIRLSSYDMMTEGSMGAATGRDVFLIYDPAAEKLRPGHVDLGVTKERIWDQGCWYARMVHFLVSDVNQDGFADIGTIKEEIHCPEGEEAWEGDSYEQHPLHWYLYTADGWKREEDDSGWPDHYAELPLVGMEKSPVDFVGQVLWRSPDPSSWKSPPRYLPTYRKKLIADELRRKSKSLPRLDAK